MKYTLPPLPYAYSALEPFIDAKTMEIHHTKHHQAYIDKLNGVLEKYPDLQDHPLTDVMRDLHRIEIPESDKTLIKNHGGGHLNHSFFWTIMGAQKEIDSALVKRIEERFGSLEQFKATFTAEATGRFGSGWAWLVEDDQHVLQVYSTANQDSPYLQGHTPIIGLDVWEHAYYLQYQNRRPEYIERWWNVLTLI